VRHDKVSAEVGCHFLSNHWWILQRNITHL